MHNATRERENVQKDKHTERARGRERVKNIRELNNQKYENIKPAKVFINAHTTHTQRTHIHTPLANALYYTDSTRIYKGIILA